MERDALKFYNDKTTLNFNSHAHVERDVWDFEGVYSKFISTHTLTWSVTSVYTDRIIKIGISTHTLTWSVTSQNFMTAR